MLNIILQRLTNLTIGLRLTIGVTLIILLTFIVGLVGWLTLESQSKSKDIENRAIDLVSVLRSARQDEKNYILRGDNSYEKKALEAIENIRINAEVLKHSLSLDQQITINKLLKERKKYKEEFKNFVLLNNKKDKNLEEMISQGRKLENTAISLRNDQKKEFQRLESISVSASEQRQEKSEKADDANRMIKLMGEARQQEKNFLLRGEKRYADITKQLVDKLIIQASSTKERFEDIQNKLLAQQIIDAAGSYIEELNIVLAGKKEAMLVDKEMIRLGREVEELSIQLREDQKKELINLENELLKNPQVRLDKREKADTSNRIIKLMSKVRQQEKNFLLRKERSYVEVTFSLVRKVIKEATGLKNSFIDKQNKFLTTKIIKAAEQYLVEFEKVVKITQDNTQAQDTMASLGRIVEDKAIQLRSDQKQELKRLEKLSTTSSKQRLDKGIKADKANRIIKLMGEARQQEKNFLLHHENFYIELTRTLVMQAVREAQLLGARFQDKQNLDLVDKITFAAERYLKEFEDVVLTDKEQKSQQDRMLTAARNIEELAKIIRNHTKEEATSVKETAVLTIFVTVMLSLFIGFGTSILLTNTVARPIRQLVDVINKLAKEDNVEVPLVSNKDEIGQIARAISNFKEVILKRKSKTEAQLIQAEKMVALGNLVAGVAHEINTPIGIAVTGSTHLQDQIKKLEKTFELGLLKKAEFRSFIDNAVPTASTIHNNLERATILIKSFKQVAVDQSSQELRKFILFEYIQDILTSLHPKLKQVKHKVSLLGDKKLIVETVPGAISQIITNLTMNSLIHAFNKNDIGNISINVNSKDDMAIITYNDDGKGMEETTIKRIYEPFFTTTRGSGGSGLGLSIIYNLVTQTLNGTIECESDLEKGTTFYINFPLKNIDIGLKNG